MSGYAALAVFAVGRRSPAYHSAMTNSHNQPRNVDPALGRAIKVIRTRKGISQRAACAMIGVSMTAYQKWEEGRGLSPVRMQQICQAFGITVADLLLEREMQVSSPSGPTTPLPGPVRSVGRVPVFGFAAGSGEKLAMNDQAVMRWIEPHPAQTTHRDIGACEIIGESMWPRYKPGELVYFVRNRFPMRGADVVLELTCGAAVVKEYDGQRDGRVWLREYHPEERLISFPMDAVKGFHAIVGRG
jgi:phage repressor protein C with HTH and peptisase S24 domain